MNDSSGGLFILGILPILVVAMVIIVIAWRKVRGK